ncbi:hypothetical protein B0H14DRAFT_3424032 [Mycena olivaceomarginata]|nr:hypothetical protein B0H14DRAFT_3424032 [Mycena olivaceomarginata]
MSVVSLADVTESCVLAADDSVELDNRARVIAPTILAPHAYAADAAWTPSIPAGVRLSRTAQRHSYLAEHDGPNEWARVQYNRDPPRIRHGLWAHLRMPSEREADRAAHRLRRLTVL